MLEIGVPVFENVYHKEMWNNIVEELKKLEYNKKIAFYSFNNLKIHYYNKLNYKGRRPCYYCFACEYARQFESKNDWCTDCPFKGIDLNKECLNNVYIKCRRYYYVMCLTKIESRFNKYKQICIENSIKIRDWEVRNDVICRSQLE